MLSSVLKTLIKETKSSTLNSTMFWF